jgi:hypothetical protein
MITFEMTGFVTCKDATREIKYKEDFVKWTKRFGWVQVQFNKSYTKLYI